jgi:hypothetical protein
MTDEYQEGLRDGKIESLEATVKKAHDRIDSHDKRLTAQERITYSLLGALALIQVWPTIEKIIQ